MLMKPMLLSELGFPQTGEILSGHEVLGTDYKFSNDVFTYDIRFPRSVKRADIPNLLRSFFAQQLLNLEDGEYVAQAHDYSVKVGLKNTSVHGDISIVPIAKSNPKKAELTPMEDFNQEYSKMEENNPENYFKTHTYGSFNTPQFRDKLFGFVSMMGENYGYCDTNQVYHRRASLIMPQIKITKAIPKAKMFYHTHPSKDEPSLSSPEDYLLYFDMSHEPRNIRHFYTVMKDRMDHFYVVPKKQKKSDYVKIDEDKILQEIDAKIDEIQDKLSDSYGDDKQGGLEFCEGVTRETVKWINKKYKAYFKIKYKCYHRVRKNPNDVDATSLHLENEFLMKATNDIKAGDYIWPEFDSKELPHEQYAYWHAQYYFMVPTGARIRHSGLPPGDLRRLDYFIHKQIEGSDYTYYDVLNILTLSHDINKQDESNRDGGGYQTRIDELLDYIGIEGNLKEDIAAIEDILHSDPYSDTAKGFGEYIVPILLAHFSIQATDMMGKAKEDITTLEQIRVTVYAPFKEKVMTHLVESMGELNKTVRAEKIPVPVMQPGGKIEMVTHGINPPPDLKTTELKATVPTSIFDDAEFLKDRLSEFDPAKQDKPDKTLMGEHQWNLRYITDDNKVTMMLYPTGTVNVIVMGEGNHEQAALNAYGKLIDVLKKNGLVKQDDPIAEGLDDAVFDNLPWRVESQENPYIIIKEPWSNYKVPIDERLAPLLQHLWNNGVPTSYSDQGLIEGKRGYLIIRWPYDYAKPMVDNLIRDKVVTLDAGKISLWKGGDRAFPENSIVIRWHGEAELKKIYKEFKLPYPESRAIAIKQVKEMGGTVHKTATPVPSLLSALKNPPMTGEQVIKAIDKKNLFADAKFGTLFTIPNTRYLLKIELWGDVDYYNALTEYIDKGKAKPDYPFEGELKKTDYDFDLRVGQPLYMLDGIHIVMEKIAGYPIDSKIPYTTWKQIKAEKLPKKNYSKQSMKEYYDHIEEMANLPQETWDELVADIKLLTSKGYRHDVHSGNIIYNKEKKKLYTIDWWWTVDVSSDTTKKNFSPPFVQLVERTTMMHWIPRMAKHFYETKGQEREREYFHKREPKANKHRLTVYDKVKKAFKNNNFERSRTNIESSMMLGRMKECEPYPDLFKRYLALPVSEHRGEGEVEGPKGSVRFGDIDRKVPMMNPPKIDSVSQMIPTSTKNDLLRFYDRRVKLLFRYTTHSKKKSPLAQKRNKKKLDLLRKEYNWKGRTGASLFEAIAKQIDSEIDSKHSIKLYRAAFMMPVSQDDLEKGFRLKGLGRAWSSYKEGADNYIMNGKFGYDYMFGGKQFLMECRADLSIINWRPTFQNRLAFPQEREFSLTDEVFLKKVSIWSIDDRARFRYLKWNTTGKNWKPWIDPKFKPEQVFKFNENFPILDEEDPQPEMVPYDNPEEKHENSIIYGMMKNPGKLRKIARGAVGGATTALVLGQLGPQVATPEEILTVPAGAILGGMAAAFSDEPRENPPLRVVSSFSSEDGIGRFYDAKTGEELTGRIFNGATMDTTDGLKIDVGEEMTSDELKKDYGRRMFNTHAPGKRGTDWRHTLLNVAKWDDRSIIQVTTFPNSLYFDTATIDGPVFLFSDPTQDREPTVFLVAKGHKEIVGYDKLDSGVVKRGARAGFLKVPSGEITDFQGGAKSHGGFDYVAKSLKVVTLKKRKNPPKILTPTYLRKHPETLFVFGDNDMRTGKGGQAVNRDEPNAVGFRTKHKPTTDADAYYTDDNYADNIRKMKEDLDTIYRLSTNYNSVFFMPGIGEGHALLKEKAPKTYQWIQNNLPDLPNSWSQKNPSGFPRDMERTLPPWDVKVPSEVKATVSAIPVVEEGKIRLYRGERGPGGHFPEGSYGGVFYTDDLAYAWANAMSPIYSGSDKTYFDLKADIKGTPAKIVYVDLPISEAKTYWSGRKRLSIPGQLAQVALGKKLDYPSHVVIPTKEFRAKEWILPKAITDTCKTAIEFVWDNPPWRHGEALDPEDDPFSDMFDE